MYVLDNGNARVQKFSFDGVHLQTWGSLSSPHGISFDPSGSILIANSGADKIIRYSTTGVLLDQFGSAGNGNGQLASPRGVAAGADGTIYVADTFNNRVQAFTSTGTFISAWPGLQSPTGIAVSSNNRVYVTEFAGDRVSIFDTNGTPLGSFGSTGSADGQFQTPNGIAVTPGYVLVSDIDNNRIELFSEIGAFQLTWGQLGTGDGQFTGPRGVAVIGGTVFVADTQNDRIQKFQVTELTDPSPSVTLAFAPPTGSSVYLLTSELLPTSATDPAHYLVESVSPNTDTLTVLTTSLDEDLLELTMAEPILPTREYQVTLSGVVTFEGTPLQSGPYPLRVRNVLSGFYFSDLILTATTPGPTYYVVGDVFLQAGNLLRVDPGVSIRFLSNHDILSGGSFPSLSEMQVQGTIVASGTSADSIHVTALSSPTPPGDWGEIRFEGTGTAAFQYCDVQGATTALRSTSTGVLDVAHCTIGSISTDAIVASGGTLSIQSSQIHDVLAGRAVFASNCDLDIQSSHFESVKKQALHVTSSQGRIQRNRIESVGGHMGGPRYPAIEASGSEVSVWWNRISEVGGSGILISTPTVPTRVLADSVEMVGSDGIHITSVSPDTVDACHVFDAAGDGISLATGGNTVVANNLVVRCDNGIQLAGNPMILDYLTVVDCTTDGVNLGNSNSQLTNSIVVGSGQYGVSGTNANASIQYMDVWSSGTAAYDNVACSFGCYSLDPDFQNAAADDYHLTPGSVFRILGEGDTQMGRYGPNPGAVTGVGDPLTGPRIAPFLAVHPNPFSTSTTLTVIVDDPGTVILDVFSITGQRVRREGPLSISAGLNDIRIPRDGLPSGVYFYRVSCGSQRATGKLIITE